METASYSLFFNSGPTALLILALAFIATTLFVERLLFLHKGQIRALSFLMGIKNLLKKHRLLEALTVCEETPGPMAQVVKTALLHHDKPEAMLRGEVERAALLQLPVIERRLGSLLIIAQIAPLLGLLGTLIAFLHGFLKMQAAGPYAQAALFAADIIDALICLILGLVLSITAYIGHHFLKGRVRAIVHDIEWAGSDILQFLLVGIETPEETTIMTEISTQHPEKDA